MGGLADMAGGACSLLQGEGVGQYAAHGFRGKGVGG